MKKKLQLDAFNNDSDAGGANDYGNEEDAEHHDPGFGTTRFELNNRQASRTMKVQAPLSSTNRLKKQKDRFNKKMNQIDKMEIK